MEVADHGVPELHEQQVKPDEEMEDVGEPEVIPSHDVPLSLQVGGVSGTVHIMSTQKPCNRLMIRISFNACGPGIEQPRVDDNVTTVTVVDSHVASADLPASVAAIGTITPRDVS